MQVKVEHGLAEFLTTRQCSTTGEAPPACYQLPLPLLTTSLPLPFSPLPSPAVHFTEQTEPLSAEELNQVLEGELDKFYVRHFRPPTPIFAVPRPAPAIHAPLLLTSLPV